MRKYDKKNKENIAFVVIICLIILSAFALFIKRVIELDKKEYIISSNSVLFDHEKNKITTDATGTIKIKWSGAYYLRYKEKEIALDRQVVVFNNATKAINLYGTIYKINYDESVDTLKDETIIENSQIPKFYKLADRKYLLIAPKIKSEDKSFSTSNYLIVELDKMGNATLVNNKVNMKTLKPTKLITTTYTFDIANETLDYNGTLINLKKIIGSTNLYKESIESKESADESGESTDESTGTGNDIESTSNQEEKGSSASNSNNGSGGAVSSITDTRIYQDKNFSVIKNTVGTDYLSVDYSVYDPKSEYKTIFMEIRDTSNNTTESYYLAKNATNILIRGLNPQTTYEVVYKYSYLDTNLNVLYDSFDTTYTISTLLPVTTLSVSRLTNKEIIYTVSEESDLMLGATVELYVDNIYKTSYTFGSDSLTNSFVGRFDLSGYGKFDYVTLKCTKIMYSNGPVDVNIELKEKN